MAAACNAAKEAKSNPCRLEASWLESPDELLVDDLLEDLFELLTYEEYTESWDLAAPFEL